MSNHDADDDLEKAISLGSQLIYEILSSSPSDLPKLKKLVDDGAALWYRQDDDGGLSALHAACLVESPELVQFLIDKGAIWNSVDDVGNTAADIALSLNDEVSYRIIRDAGLRSEFLLQVLSNDEDSAPNVLRNVDNGAFGSTDAFLDSSLVYSRDEFGQEICGVKSGDETVGVMMGWERGIMETTVEKLCADHPLKASGLRVLNIGFGLGIVDTLFQSIDPPPSLYTIIEPHKDVLAHMRATGWYDRPNVKILEGRWQDFVEQSDIYGNGGWDVVYIDTFAEGYEELKKFFDVLPDLLSGPEARFSFFNGLGATNWLFYDVYTQLAELHLKDAGVEVEWSDVDVEDGSAQDRWGDTKSYFKARLYRLPIGKMVAM
ncbi:hypothetical protein M422DRAFT_29486 [Sphaerobolus stellatus SS14]|uniref:RMT2 domain-containing protein n=1 Tax=Sphaerobolus stellatus (strain SS14) TaxID=990650 RepID=A0A0C9W468_SPHS4|nr:hypothetical protein M422DRAFT_29486 [Sphaerobolus stellatus SS14]